MSGRPSTFTQEQADAICEWIADGKSLRKFCEIDSNPSKVTVLKWLGQSREFATQYARAREMQADSHVDDIADIADTETDPAKARVRIDARKWAASKLAPKKYGDRLELAGQVTVAKPSRKAVSPEDAEAEWEANNPTS